MLFVDRPELLVRLEPGRVMRGNARVLIESLPCEFGQQNVVPERDHRVFLEPGWHPVENQLAQLRELMALGLQVKDESVVASADAVADVVEDGCLARSLPADDKTSVALLSLCCLPGHDEVVTEATDFVFGGDVAEVDALKQVLRSGPGSADFL